MLCNVKPWNGISAASRKLCRLTQKRLSKCFERITFPRSIMSSILCQKRCQLFPLSFLSNSKYFLPNSFDVWYYLSISATELFIRGRILAGSSWKILTGVIKLKGIWCRIRYLRHPDVGGASWDDQQVIVPHLQVLVPQHVCHLRYRSLN